MLNPREKDFIWSRVSIIMRIGEEVLSSLGPAVFAVRVSWVVVGPPVQREMASVMAIWFAVIFNA